MDWLEEILSWPASWSALHGIAEVKTPVLKASTRTDATAHEFIVRRHGPRLPAEAVAGLGFPFRTSGTTRHYAFAGVPEGARGANRAADGAPGVVRERQRVQRARRNG